MHVVLFAQRIFPPRIEGIQNNTVLLGKELSKKCSIDIISHQSPTELQTSSYIDTIPVHHFFCLSDNPFLQIWYSLIGTRKTMLFFRKHNIDVVCFQYLETSFIISMLTIAFLFPSIKFFLTLYSLDEVHIGYKKMTLKLLLSKIHSLIIISPYLQYTLEHIGFPSHKIVYIPLSFDKEKYAHFASFDSRKTKTLLFSAGIVPEAGSYLMVDLAKLMPSYTFIFAMRKFNSKSEKDFSQLQQYIHNQGVKNIIMKRNIVHMEELLGTVSALILPLLDIRIKMLIPVALLEAMARGTLCFVSNLPNLQLLVSDKKNAIIFDRYSIQDLQQKIETYIDREDIAQEAHVFGKQFPDYSDIALQYFTLFTKV